VLLCANNINITVRREDHSSKAAAMDAERKAVYDPVVDLSTLAAKWDKQTTPPSSLNTRLQLTDRAAC
jgi:hypothetical protein